MDATPADPPLALSSTEAHLWYADPEAISEPRLLESFMALLSPDEEDRRRRFHFERDRHSFLVTRALVRTVLSRYAAVAPTAWAFVPNGYGRPEIAGPEGVPPLCFNLSHTRGLVVCLVALGRDVGVDVEPVDRPAPSIGLAERYFAPAEVARLRRLAPAEFASTFLDLWTLKESYIKARGMGLSLPLADFAFHLDAEPVRISFTPNIDDDPSSWQFTKFVLRDRHKVAVAMRRPPGEVVSLTCFPFRAATQRET
jgi:4'-phosphopantetheinyl transferase